MAECPVKSLQLDFVIERAAIVARARHFADDTMLVACDHAGHTLHQVAKFVSELIVVGVLKLFPSEIAILDGGNVPQKEIAKGINAVCINNLNRIDDITEAFAHLGAAGQNKTMHQ